MKKHLPTNMAVVWVTTLSQTKNNLYSRGNSPAKKGVFSRMIKNARTSGSCLRPVRPFTNVPSASSEDFKK